jgi:peptidylprolyl isomerase
VKAWFAGLAMAVFAFVLPAAAQTPKLDPQNTLIIELKTGKVTIALRPDLAPKHVERVKKLAREGFYNGVKFHRVIAGFMAQTGDPTGTGTGGSKYPDLPAEFTPTPFERGTVGAARTSNPNSANSQFFICFTHTPSLNGQYTVWGRVVDGMANVDQVAKGEPPANPDKMLKVYVLADAGKAGTAKK